jgi:hypothetical protein
VEQLLNVKATRALPLLHRLAELPRQGKPEDRMHMIRHDDETYAPASQPVQLAVQCAEHATFGLVVI